MSTSRKRSAAAAKGATAIAAGNDCEAVAGSDTAAATTPPKRSKAATATTAVEDSASSKTASAAAAGKGNNLRAGAATKAKAAASANSPLARHVRDITRKVPLLDSEEFVKIITWNVNGFKTLAKNNLNTLLGLVEVEQPDFLCLQETKLQKVHVDEYRNSIPGYSGFWTCSVVKSGYSGTVIFVKNEILAQSSPVVISPDSINNKTAAPLSAESGTAAGSKKQAALTSFFKKAPKPDSAPPLSTSSSSSSQVEGGEKKKEEVKDAVGKRRTAQIKVEKVVLDLADQADTTRDGGSAASAAAGSTSAVSSAPPRKGLNGTLLVRYRKDLAGEGRTIVLETDKFVLVACYVPNSGEGLTRLDFRVEEWDTFLQSYLCTLRETTQKPVIFTGDMNCGHQDLDIHNPSAKHIVKQAGLTPRERDSFTAMLTIPLNYREKTAATVSAAAAAGEEVLRKEDISKTGPYMFRDAFRYFYPDARGQFTYWSMRAFGRPVNKGIRLDYFVCSHDLFPVKTWREPNDDNGDDKSEGTDMKKKAICAEGGDGAGEKKIEVEEEEENMLGGKPRVVHPAVDVRSALPIPGVCVYDCYILARETEGSSDHCPVVLVLKL